MSTTPASLLAYPKEPTGTNAHLAPANASQLHQDLLAARRWVNDARRTLRGAYQALVENPGDVARYREELHEAVDTYNAAVAAWHRAWTPWREAEKARRQRVRDQLRADQERTARAQLRAQACTGCGLIHAGEC